MSVILVNFNWKCKSIVRSVLMTFSNSFLVARGQCLGTWFVCRERSVKHHYSLSLLLLLSTPDPGGSTPVQAAFSPALITPADIWPPVGFPPWTHKWLIWRAKSEQRCWGHQGYCLSVFSFLLIFSVSPSVIFSWGKMVFILPLCSWTQGQNWAWSPWVSDLPNFWSLIKVCQAEFFKSRIWKKCLKSPQCVPVLKQEGGHGPWDDTSDHGSIWFRSVPSMIFTICSLIAKQKAWKHSRFFPNALFGPSWWKR